MQVWAGGGCVRGYSISKGRFSPFVYLEEYLWARELIAEGIIWRIDNGTRVNIWNDPWLPDLENSRLLFQNFIPQLKIVNQLIESETNTWNKELLGGFVDEDQLKRIFAIPINSMVVRKHDATGEFSVKSGYGVLLTELNQNKSYNLPNAENYMDFYKALWTTQIPPKVKIHVWRLFKNFGAAVL
ncbi:non-ltr retroelement reverse transcriptase [Gossypium australe]|uniref:Non-ltr retroelement reverse transcriptase n=1 Tax=Gossypium australe TaxID=47621 RepID=A0A5B6WCD5_9ROSI|nr:non-ltr retroelement reverse transcriptase [Gossypium australe]